MRLPEQRSLFGYRSALRFFTTIKTNAETNNCSFAEEVQREIKKANVTPRKFEEMVNGRIQPKAKIEKLLLWAKDNLREEGTETQETALQQPGHG
ncbi:hypothetical protein Lbir_1662 [Legionella birminghamensis]|uniref:Uncharacterized protein n=1 Tax=Legionella birminghamensis TaxID=28083 RepID=A0A378I7R2_9GAMM|nr:hypothetical protein [Legionella birminghamensis]KTC71510.1 hypothetical protein Lbir_1662 [Legionella birminghamensis]STX30882.1 Uncharacterised protein [Legionella birminghamensis]